MKKISFFQWVINYLKRLDLQNLDNTDLKENLILRNSAVTNLVFLIFNWSKCEYMSDIPQIHLMELDWKKYCSSNNIFKISDVNIISIPLKKLKVNFD